MAGCGPLRGGANEYLKVVSDYDKQPTWLDRLSLLDLF